MRSEDGHNGTLRFGVNCERLGDLVVCGESQIALFEETDATFSIAGPLAPQQLVADADDTHAPTRISVCHSVVNKKSGSAHNVHTKEGETPPTCGSSQLQAFNDPLPLKLHNMACL